MSKQNFLNFFSNSNKNFFLFITLFFLLSSFSLCEDMCPTGMRRTYFGYDIKFSNGIKYLDEEKKEIDWPNSPYSYYNNLYAAGSAKNDIGSLSFGEGAGSLWYGLGILLERRLEIHMKVQTLGVCKENCVNGFAIVLSSNDYIQASIRTGTKGFDYIQNSYIVDFNFKDGANKVLVHRCFGSEYCKEKDNYANVYGIENQQYVYNKPMNWEFTLSYSNKKLSLYSGDVAIYSENIDLEENFKSTVVYLGTFGSLGDNGHSEVLFTNGTFFCQDNFDTTKMPGTFYIDNEYVDKDYLNFTAGELFKYSFSFVNNQGYKIPHCYESHIWAYSFTIYIDCNTADGSGQLKTIDKYNIWLSLGCTNAGLHTVKLKSDYGANPVRYYYIVPADLAIIKLVGYEGEIRDVPMENDKASSDLRILKFGTAVDKNFIISDSFNVTLELNLTDKYGNPVDLETNDSSVLLSKAKLSSNGAKLTMSRVEDHYRLTIYFNAPGTFKIYKNSFMEYGYEFIVYPGSPDPTVSACSIKNVDSSPTIDEGQKLIYSCNIKDVLGNSLTSNEMRAVYDFSFSCDAKRNHPSEIVFQLEPEDKQVYFDCPMEPNLMGDYKFEGFFYKNSQPEKKLEINSNINTFNVLPIPINFDGAKAYQISTGLWFSQSDATFPYKKDSNGFLTALDLTDRDGKTLISSYGTYSPNFSLSSLMNTKLTSPHDPNFAFKDLVLKWLTLDGKPYIGVYTKGFKDTDEWIMKSSFDYQIVSTLKSVVDQKTSNFVVTLKYQLVPALIGTYTTCFHDLDPKSTIVNYEYNENGKFKAKVGTQIKIGTLVLQTKDKYLYNYDIGTDKITVKTTPSTNSLKFDIIQNTIPGTYTIYCTSNEAVDTDFDIYVNDEKVTDPSHITYEAGKCYYIEIQNPSLYSISESTYSLKENPTIDNNVEHRYIVKDKFNNVLDKDDVGLAISFQVDGKSVPQGYTNAYDSSNKNYKLTDTYSGLGEYGITLKCSESGNSVNIAYTKNTGEINVEKSKMVLNSNNIHVNEISYVEVTLNDKLGNNIGKSRLEESKDKISVTGKDTNGKSYTYTFDQITNSNTLRFKMTATEEGTITVTGKYSSSSTSIPCPNPILKVAYDTIAVENNKLYALLDTSHLMSTNDLFKIKSASQVPVYQLYFYNENGVQIKDYDHSISISCVMTSQKSGNQWVLIVTKYSDNVRFKHTDADTKNYKSLPRGYYDLIVEIGGKSVKYPLYLIGEDGSEDASDLPDFDPSKVYPPKIEITGIAGVTYTGNIEFRASDDLRWNYQGDISKFSFRNSYNLDSEELIAKADYGGKKGKFILSFVQTKVTEEDNPNVVSIYYDGKELNTKVYLTITNAALEKLIYISGKRDGTVKDLPILLFKATDKYGNEVKELLDSTVYPTKSLNKLTMGATSNKVDIVTNNFVEPSKDTYLHVQYQVKQVTTITVTSSYFTESHSYKIRSGPIFSGNTRVEFNQGPYKIPDSNVKYVITPQDEYGNPVDSLNSNDLEDFSIVYYNDKNPKKAITVKQKNDCKVDTSKLVINCGTAVYEAGVDTFDVKYKASDVQCSGPCYVTVLPGALDFTKTKAYYVNGQYYLSHTDENIIQIASLAKFKLIFNDKYGNEIIDAKEVQAYDISSILSYKSEPTEVKLCVSGSENYKLISVCSDSDENIQNWFYLVNGGDYALEVENKNSEVLTYPLQLVGGESDDGSSGALDVSKTEFDPNSITVVAGVEGEVNMELKATDGKRKNKWYKNPEEEIKIKFLEDEDKCSYNIKYGNKPGQYVIVFKCTKVNNKNGFNAYIEKTKAPTTVQVQVVPAAPYKAILFEASTTLKPGNEIKVASIGKATADDKISTFFRLYDVYGNQVQEFSVSSLGLVFKLYKDNENSGSSTKTEFKTQIMGDENDKFGKITMGSEKSAVYRLYSQYFLEPLTYYEVEFTAGKIYPENCKINVNEKTVVAGSKVKAFITPYDKYGNYIDPSGKTNPFYVSFEYDVEKDDGTTKKEKSTILNTDSTVGKFDSLNSFEYTAELIHKGENHFQGYVPETDEEAICVSCMVKVEAGEVDFLNSDYKRYEPSKEGFITFKDGAVEKNANDEIIYKVYPRDKYGNKIEYYPEEILKTYTCFLTNKKDKTVYNLRIGNEKYSEQEYALFVKNDIPEKQITYATLVGGQYTATFSNKVNNKVFNITLSGTDGDHDASNEDADIQKTNLNSYNLEFVAGDTGDMFLEIRTINNLRKNFWEGFDIEILSCDTSDSTFKYTVEKSGTYGVFYVTVTTQKANTFPKYVDCPLTIKINKEEVKALKPLMKVHPNVLMRSMILEKYYKVAGNSEILIDGNSDKKYVFEVKSFDVYDNLCQTKQEIIGIGITHQGVDIPSVQVEDPETGYLKYTLDTKKAGDYLITSKLKKNGKQYLPNDSKFTVLHGKLCPSETEIKIDKSIYTAGEKPQLYLISKDCQGNIIPAEEAKEKYQVSIVDPVGTDFPTSDAVSTSDPNKLVFTTKDPVTIAGEGFCKVIYPETGEDIADSGKIDKKITIIPGVADPKMSLVSFENANSAWVETANNTKIAASITKPIKIRIKIRDTYGNKISPIPDTVTVSNALLQGNDMTPIIFDVSKTNEYFSLDFSNNSTAMAIYEHLVTGDNYELPFEVKSPLGQAGFLYPVSLSTNRDDSGYGNGDVAPEKCVLTPESVEFTAGDKEYYTLELRTKKGLLYNNAFDVNDEKKLAVNIEKEDKSFKYSIYAKGTNYGIYVIEITSTKKQVNKIKVKIFDKEKNTLSPIKNDANFKVNPKDYPERKETEITARPPEVLDSETKVSISFILADEYANIFEGRTDLTEGILIAQQNGGKVPDAVFTLADDGKTYTVTFLASYPPRDILVNVVFDNGKKSVICFPEDIKIKITSKVNYKKAEIVSKNAITITVGEVLDMQIYLYDSKGICVEEDYSAELETTVVGPYNNEGAKSEQKKYKFKKITNPDLDCQNEYEIITEIPKDVYTKIGTYNISVTGNGMEIGSYVQTCKAGDNDINGFTFEFVGENFDPEDVKANTDVEVRITGKDFYGNPLKNPLKGDMVLTISQHGEPVNFTRITESEHDAGELFITFATTRIGKVDLGLTYKGEKVTKVNGNQDIPYIIVSVGACSGSEEAAHIDDSMFPNATINNKVYFIVTCYDDYGNRISTGGESFAATVQYIVDKNTRTRIPATFVDNKDGTYTGSFIPRQKGNYSINVEMNNNQYGNPLSLYVTDYKCKYPNNFLCPNTGECVDNPVKCIQPKNNCPIEKPFNCTVDGVHICVKSQNDCDCPQGYVRCETFMHYCVKEEKEYYMCPSYDLTRCKNRMIFNEDGICRKTKDIPSMRVCPTGYSLCPDLSCVLGDPTKCDMHEKVKEDDCELAVICANNACTSTNDECPSVIKCSEEGQVVCPDGTCVQNEIYCQAYKNQCTDDNPYRCADGSCAQDYTKCPQPIACGENLFLCEDFTCRQKC